jgi:predicted nucleic acid-binding protein
LPVVFDDAIRRVALYEAAFVTPPTTIEVIDTACALARAHRMQLWDCVVCVASAHAGAKALLTEDMQDGRILDGLRLINPFAPGNTEAIEALLASR